MENKERPHIFYGQLDNPDWPLYLAATAEGLCFIGSLDEGFDELTKWAEKYTPYALLEENEGEVAVYAKQLQEYFKGERSQFELPIDTTGTAFQQEVWAALMELPYGATTSYGEIASRINKPGSSRAVGTAIGKNPVLIVVPCHRVIHKNGGISGYRGKLPMKKKLLELEAVRRNGYRSSILLD
ncbi:MAG: methylated-DNA--[protein]-cysteine S-methyltransferase [Carnobacterium sp.]|uniref:methylated-DNA--[protein]-cysteine S-methyltransferase n=1 Tax=unclassified Carnobacterium TaxID=257487 RepID=UPI0019113698|nr:methylated-DNA--[protein]-cysteine S-methyltransferase [Carnobacterium sp. CS13]QQP70539.1 methylated-DNA--[protein]-cysteine S-methyltransferase [Carnobacterium sp. CS13]